MISRINPELSTQEGSPRTILVVILHGYMYTPARLDPVRRVVSNEMPEADILVPELPLGVFSVVDLNEIVQSLVEKIDKYWKERRELADRQSYDKIILVGHSCGALMARKVYVVACGENQDAPFESGLEKEGREWAGKVERLVLLAGMNRGWEINHHLSLFHAVCWTLGVWSENLLRVIFRGQPVILDVRRGAPFITQLRIQWLSMCQRHPEGRALTIQLLGSIDDYVSPEDNVDLFTGADFFYLDVPFTGHSNIIEMDDSKPVRDPDPKDKSHAGSHRRKTFLFALKATRDELKKESVQPGDMMPDPPNEEVKDVIFVIHGIRDQGYWTNKIAREIKRRGREANRVFESKTSTYGYFPMLPFLFSSDRRAKVEWLMDQYTQAKAQYPKAEFSYVGHSNGTYLLARALLDYTCCRFKNVVFAGSVVRTDYDWSQFLDSEPPRIKSILNYVATSDLVVAFFPKAMELLRFQDLGSAGFDGFKKFIGNSSRSEIRYIKGGHGAALDERNWAAIASFIVDGRIPSKDEKWIERERPKIDKLLIENPSKVAPVLWAVGIGILVFLARCIWLLPLPETAWTALFIGFCWLGIVIK